MHSGGVQLFGQRSQPAQSDFFWSRAWLYVPRGGGGRLNGPSGGERVLGGGDWGCSEVVRPRWVEGGAAAGRAGGLTLSCSGCRCALGSASASASCGSQGACFGLRRRPVGYGQLWGRLVAP